MITASQLRPGAAIRYEGQPYKVVAAEYHSGQGKMGGQTHARLLNLVTGTTWAHSFRSELKLEEIRLEKRSLEFLYSSDNHCFFMDPDTFEQIPVDTELVGDRAVFLMPSMRLLVEFLEDRPVGAVFPDSLEVRVTDTAPALHQQQDANFKTAKLESGVEVMVPQFIKTGDVVRIDLTTLRYMDRVAGK